MSIIRPFIWLAALATAIGLTAPGSAQTYQPFIDPNYFGLPDLQFFAPAEVGDYSGLEPPNTGFYFDFDRLYLYANRPDGEASLFSDNIGDFAWGNRYEMGYMTDEKQGWQVLIWNLNGPNENLVNAELQQFQTVDVPTASTQLDNYFYGLSSLNTMELTSVELNKIWRRKEFHEGSVLELLLGFRQMTLIDYYRRDILGELPGPIAATSFVTYDSELAEFNNFMYGGQLGGRWFQQRGHWLLSFETRFFALANNQSLKNEQVNKILDFDPVDATLIDVIGTDVNRSRTYSHANQFVWGGEFRLEAAYELTRDISLRVGSQFTDLGRGIGRGNLLRMNDQDVQLAGVTFGLTVNR